MDTTTNRILLLCDGDKRLISSLLSEIAKRVTVRDLQLEHAWHDSFKVIVAAVDMYTPALEQVAKSITELCNKIKESLQLPIEPLSKSLMADYRQAWMKYCNNYRKLHHLPMRRCRCRWRPRESRRVMEGLSPGVVIDEYAFADEGEMR